MVFHASELSAQTVAASNLAREPLYESSFQETAKALEKRFQLDPAQLCNQGFQLTIAQLCRRSTRSKKSFQLTIAQLCFNSPTRARELELSLAHLCKSPSATKSLQQELEAAYLLGQTKARELQCTTLHTELAASKRQALTTELAQLQPSRLAGTAAATAAGKLQVARDLRRPESIHYEPFPQTMQSYLALDVHDMYMDLRTVVQNNLARKRPDPAGAEELRYENAFPTLTAGSVDLAVTALTYHPKNSDKNGVKGEVGSIHLRGGRSTTSLFKFVATVIMAVWANLPFGLWPGMGMSAYFAYPIVGFKGQSNPVKKVMIAVAIHDVIFIVMSLLAIRLMIFKIFSAWMMKAPMTGIGMFLAFIGLQSGKGIIRDHLAVIDDLVEELENHFKMQKWLEKLEKYWEYTRKIFDLQLRASCKVRHQFSLENQNENENENHNENESENENHNENENENEKNFNITASSELPQEAASTKQNGSFRKRSLHSIEDEIFNEKLVPLLLQWHFAKAASFQLDWHEAWKKYREASKKTVFEKWKDKARPHQLRREQLDCKDLRSASFKAFCLSTFDGNTFTEESFKESTFNEETFKEATFQEETFKEETFPEESFEDSSLKEETFSDTSLEEETFSESSFENSSFADSSLEEETFSENTFEESSLDKSSLDKHSFPENSLDKSRFTKHRFNQSSLEESSFDKSSFQKSSFEDPLYKEQLPEEQL